MFNSIRKLIGIMKNNAGRQIHEGIASLTTNKDFREHERKILIHWQNWENVPAKTRRHFFHTWAAFTEKNAEEANARGRKVKYILHSLDAADRYRLGEAMDKMHSRLNSLFDALEEAPDDELPNLFHTGTVTDTSLRNSIERIPASHRRRYRYDKRLTDFEDRLRKADERRRRR